MSLLASPESLLKNERLGVLAPKDTFASYKVNSKNRSILVDWFIQVAEEYNIKQDTFHATVNIVDAYLARNTITLKQLQLIGITSMYMAGKYNEVQHLHIDDLVELADGAYKKEEIVDKEREIFIALGCNINLPIDIDYLRIINLESKVPLEPHVMSKHLLRICSMDMSDFLPSVVCAAAVKITSDIKGSNYGKYFDIPDSVINICANRIIKFCGALQSSKLKGYKKLGAGPIENGRWLKFLGAVATQKLYKIQVDRNELLLFYRTTYYRQDLTFSLLSVAEMPKPTRKLGEGAYGVVQQVEFKGISYAVKELRQGLATSGLSSSYLREVSITLSLSHPNIIRARRITSDLNSIFFDLAESDLKGWIKQQGSLNFDMQFVLAEQMFGALAYLKWSGTLHRDIKPQNILVFYQSEGPPTFVLADFGLARGCQIALKGSFYTHEVVTLWWRPPEILLGKDNYDDKVDVWSMICTLYEAATSNPLFTGYNEVDQLHKIFFVLGTPTEADWKGVESLPSYKYVAQYKFVPQPEFFAYNPYLSDLYKALMNLGLIFDPEQRPSAQELYNTIKIYKL